MNRHHLISIASKLHQSHEWITANDIKSYISTHYHIIRTTDEVMNDLRNFYKQTKSDDKVMFQFRTTDKQTEFQIHNVNHQPTPYEPKHRQR